MSNPSARAIVSLLRLPYWMMTGGLSLITAFAISKGILEPQTILLVFFSMAFITSAGFALNDYFDRESDAVIKPKRPIPSGAFSLKQVVIISSFLFALGLFLGFLISPLSFLILLIDSALLIVYSAYIKRKSGLAANILVGLLVGTAFLYGEAALPPSYAISLISLSLYPICFGTIGGNILRDILSVEGDSKVGYPTLPQLVGNKGSTMAAALFFSITAVLAPLPFFLGFFSIYYVALILIWGAILLYSSIRLLTSTPTIENVRKYERLITRSMILLNLALVVEAFVG
jgi:geranylgeranylglycerol-phosphate geranylgeranyltransferase